MIHKNAKTIDKAIKLLDSIKLNKAKEPLAKLQHGQARHELMTLLAYIGYGYTDKGKLIYYDTIKKALIERYNKKI